MLTKFDEQAQKAIVIAESIAFDLGHNNVGSEHLLLSLLKMPESKLKKLLNDLHVDEKIIYEDIKRLFGINDSQPFYMEYSDVVKEILEKSAAHAQEKNKNKVTLNLLSVALLEVKESVASELLKKYDIEVDELIFILNENTELETKLDQVSSLVNLNKKMKKNHYAIIGREEEINKLCMILSKKDKNNALIIGEAGVGKSALVEKLAQMINQKQVPAPLSNKIIYELSLSSIVAGTKYRGEFEEKLRKIIDKVKELDNVIIFIDEIHNIIGAGGAEGAIDASNILKPYLARKDMTIIGATTLEEYYKHFEHDQAMNRRFSLVTLKENTPEETKNILLGIKEYFENYHHLTIEDQMIERLVSLVDDHIKNRTFPDKAIDILDLACVKAKFKKDSQLSLSTIKQVIEEYASIKIDEEMDYDLLEKQLNHEIIGQQQAIGKIIKQLKVEQNSKKPQSVFLLTGSSGIGKTETAKILAKKMKRHLIRLDMTQYQDTSSLQKIIGAPPGYIGYDKPSLLLPELQSYPKSVLLLDEIEKANPDVLNLFLQVFDEGYLEDNQKRKVYFDQTIIVMTSNVGAQSMMGFKKTNESSLEHYFQEEFISRIDEIIRFRHLDQEDLKAIVQKNVNCHFSNQEMNELLRNYQSKTGARGMIRAAKKYLQTKEVSLNQ